MRWAAYSDLQCVRVCHSSAALETGPWELNRLQVNCTLRADSEILPSSFYSFQSLRCWLLRQDKNKPWVSERERRGEQPEGEQQSGQGGLSWAVCLEKRHGQGAGEESPWSVEAGAFLSVLPQNVDPGPAAALPENSSAEQMLRSHLGPIRSYLGGGAKESVWKPPPDALDSCSSVKTSARYSWFPTLSLHQAHLRTGAPEIPLGRQAQAPWICIFKSSPDDSDGLASWGPVRPLEWCEKCQKRALPIQPCFRHTWYLTTMTCPV